MADAKTPAAAEAPASKGGALPARPKNQPIPGTNQDDKVRAQDMMGNILPDLVPRWWLKTFSKIIKAAPSAKEGK